jgi:hypothetical protein
LGTHGFEEILLSLRPLYNSLGEHPTLLAQPFLINDSEDCNYMCKVFLSVPTGEYGHVEVGLVWKLDLQGLRFFLGHDNVYFRYVGMGGLLLSCSFLHSAFLNPSRDLRVVLILAYCQSPVPSRSFLKEDFGGTRRNPAA